MSTTMEKLKTMGNRIAEIETHEWAELIQKAADEEERAEMKGMRRKAKNRCSAKRSSEKKRNHQEKNKAHFSEMEAGYMEQVLSIAKLRRELAQANARVEQLETTVAANGGTVPPPGHHHHLLGPPAAGANHGGGANGANTDWVGNGASAAATAAAAREGASAAAGISPATSASESPQNQKKKEMSAARALGTLGSETEQAMTGSARSAKSAAAGSRWGGRSRAGSRRSKRAKLHAPGPAEDAAAAAATATADQRGHMVMQPHPHAFSGGQSMHMVMGSTHVMPNSAAAPAHMQGHMPQMIPGNPYMFPHMPQMMPGPFMFPHTMQPGMAANMAALAGDGAAGPVPDRSRPPA